MKRTKDLEDALAARMDLPDPSDWHRHYTPEQAAEYGAELADLERQLDLGWPGWRKRAPFAHLPVEKLAWVKARLLRRDLILHGWGAAGARVSWRVRGPARFPFAQPISPRHADVQPDAFRPLVSTPQLATTFGISIADVDRHLAELPAGVRDVRRWLSVRLGRGASSQARDPSQSSASPADPRGGP